MTKIPVKLSEDLILDAMVVLRFTTSVPAEVVFGSVYQAITRKFPESRLEHLPVLQIPEAFRRGNSILINQPYWRFDVACHSIWVGPKVISFSIRKPYIGWVEWRNFIMDLLPDLNVPFQDIEQISLRYVNFTERNLCDIANINISVGSSNLSCQPMTFQIESINDDVAITLRLANKATILTQLDQSRTGSVIDVEVSKRIQFCENFFNQPLGSALDDLHKIEKKSFFEILQADFLASLEPTYEGN